MESESVIDDGDRPVTGFTLELDGSPEEVARIAGAAFREMSRIQMENASIREDSFFVTGSRWPYLLGRLNVKGKITYRKDI